MYTGHKLDKHVARVRAPLTIISETLTPEDCEEVYRLNVGTLANMRFFKTGPKYIKIGRKILYKRRDIEQWLNQNVVLTSDSLEHA